MIGVFGTPARGVAVAAAIAIVVATWLPWYRSTGVGIDLWDGDRSAASLFLLTAGLTFVAAAVRTPRLRALGFGVAIGLGLVALVLALVRSGTGSEDVYILRGYGATTYAGTVGQQHTWPAITLASVALALLVVALATEIVTMRRSRTQS